MSACDAAFLSLKDDPIFKMTIPAKLQSYMACGIPVVASAAGEVKKIIEESQSGICSLPGDARKLADNLIKLKKMSKEQLKVMGNNARFYYESNFDKTKLLNIMDVYLK